MSTQQAMPAYLAELPFGKRLEAAAAMIVASSTGLILQSLDPGGGSVQLPDFSMFDEQGDVVGVLEVTTTTDANRAQFMARAGNLSWDFAELHWVWVVHVTGQVSPREIHSQIAALLRDLEQDGRTGDWIPTLPGLRDSDAGGLPQSLVDLGVQRACAFHRRASGPGSVLIGQAGSAGPFSVEAVVKAAECQLKKPDNIAKLSGTAGQAELFLWLDAGTPQAALFTLALPEFAAELAGLRVPSLPGGVTAIWVAAGSADWSRPVEALLRCDGRGWSALDLPICAEGQIEILESTGPRGQALAKGLLIRPVAP
jgi:hypothetical protein